MLSGATPAALNQGMADSERPAGAATQRPHEFDHRHGDVSGGWLRAATFGAMDGLVSNTALIAGIGAAADAHAVIVGGFAGLASGAFSMALGEYTSVRTANEQIESEEVVERRAFKKHPQAEKAELVEMLMNMGLTRPTATQATEEIHRDETRAVNFHLVQEIGVNPREKPSPYVAAISSFLMFALGAVTPLIPFLLGYESLWWGLACGGLGLMVAGGVASRFTRKPLWFASIRQLVFGAVAIAATYLVGTAVGTVIS